MFMKTIPQVTGESTKLQQRNRGPLVITKVLLNDTYGVATLRADSTRRRYTTTAHVSQLRLRKPIADDDENDNESGHESDKIESVVPNLSSTNEILPYKITTDIDENTMQLNEPEAGPSQRETADKIEDTVTPSRNHKPLARFKDYEM